MWPEPSGTGDGSSGNGDEELLDTGRPSWSRRRRRTAAGAVVVLLAVVVAVAFARHGGSGAPAPVAASTAVAAPAPVVTPTSLPSRIVFRPGPAIKPTPIPKATGDVPYRAGIDPAKCPGLTCTTRASVPQAVVGAVRRAFPGMHIVRVTTVRLASGRRPLWFREVTATSGGRSVQLVVQAHSPSDVNRDYTRIEPPAVVTYVERNLGQWHVFVTVTAPTQRDRVYGQALDLATDKRIVAT